MEQIPSDIKSFLRDGKITQFPAKLKLKVCCLFYLADKIEKNRDYTEKEINEVLNLWHTFGDPAMLRRYLCDYGFLTREKDGSRYCLSANPPADYQLFS